MAKFCTYCGKPLPESGVCDCEASQAAGQQQPQEPQAQPQEPQGQPQQPQGQSQQPQGQPVSENVYVKKTKTVVSQSVPFVKEYWKEPMNATVKVLREKNLALAVVMMVVNAIVTGLLLFTCYSKIGGALKDAVGRVDISVPFFSHLLLGIVMALVAMALSAVLLFLLLKACKVDANFVYVIVAVGVNTVPCTLCLVLALLLALFGWTTGVVLALVLGCVAWGALGFLLLTKVFGVKVTGLVLTLSCLFFTVVLGLNFWLGSKLALSAGGQIEVEGEKISDTLDDLEDMDAEDLLGSLMGGSLYGW